MKIKIKKTELSDPVKFMRRAGYGLVRGRDINFVKHFDRNPFPRFHLYLEDEGDSWSLNLHLDQRAPVYPGVSAHSGEYDGEVVEKEGERIKKML